VLLLREDGTRGDRNGHLAYIDGFVRFVAFRISHDETFQRAAAAEDRNIRAVEFHRRLRDHGADLFHAALHDGTDEDERERHDENDKDDDPEENFNPELFHATPLLAGWGEV
jgi:hypothetical protein